MTKAEARNSNLINQVRWVLKKHRTTRTNPTATIGYVMSEFYGANFNPRTNRFSTGNFGSPDVPTFEGILRARRNILANERI